MPGVRTIRDSSGTMSHRRDAAEARNLTNGCKRAKAAFPLIIKTKSCNQRSVDAEEPGLFDCFQITQIPARLSVTAGGAHGEQGARVADERGKLVKNMIIGRTQNDGTIEKKVPDMFVQTLGQKSID